MDLTVSQAAPVTPKRCLFKQNLVKQHQTRHQLLLQMGLTHEDIEMFLIKMQIMACPRILRPRSIRKQTNLAGLASLKIRLFLNYCIVLI